jgi:predicted ATPase/DNA-binding XRE family transcriptional regulator
MEDRGRRSDSSDFGSLLRSYRLAAGLSQDALAERARVSSNGISALERGRRRIPQRETLELLAGALALNAEQRRAFERAAVRTSSPRRREGGSVTLGPWPNARLANLPLSLSVFVGREAELDEIAALLNEHRVVTLAGAGGVGKTQTALRAATAFGDAAECAVCFVSLAPVGDPSLVTTSIAVALGVQEVPNHPLLETLVAFLKNKTVLLVLDNCEHVIAEATAVADFLLHGGPNLRILATSREPLRAAGERTYRLPSLDESHAIELFVDRAQAADAHFRLTDENKAFVTAICERLSGIPLAIELAAARVAVLPLRALAKAIDDRFAIPIGGERTAPPRQQTMRAAIGWSYESLEASEQLLFDRLSVFAGGCSLGAATAVCQGDGIAADDVLPLISSLISKSLVVPDFESDKPRYRLLEPFREYAHEKLKARGEAGAVAQRHVLAYLEELKSFDRSWDTLPYTVTARYPLVEINNWRVAVKWALTERGDVLLGQRLVGRILSMYGGTRFVSEMRRWVVTAIELVDEQTPLGVIAWLKCAAAIAARYLDHHRAQLTNAQEAIALFCITGDKLGLMRARLVAGEAMISLLQPREARLVLGEALSDARKFGSRRDLTSVLRQLAQASADDHELASAHRCLGEAFRLLKAAQDREGVAGATVDLANVTFAGGDAERAIRHLESALAMLNALAGESGTPSHLNAVVLGDLCAYLIFLDRHDEAERHAHDALDTALNLQFDFWVAQALETLSVLCAVRQRPKATIREKCMSAARVLGFVDAQLLATGSQRDQAAMTANRERAVAALNERLGDEVVADLMARGADMTQDEAVDAAAAL